MTQIHESTPPRWDEVELQVRHARAQDAADQAFELWQAATEVTQELFDTMERVDKAAVSAPAYFKARDEWLTARTLSSGLMLKFAQLDADAVAAFVDWVQVRDLPRQHT